MNSSQVVLLVWSLLATTYVLFLVCWVVPSLTRDRVLLRLGVLRESLDKLGPDAPGGLLHPATRAVTDLVDLVLSKGVPSVSVLATAALVAKRELGVLPRPAARAAGSNQLRVQDVALLGHLEATVVREILRGSLLGSRLAVLTWPVWLWVRRYLPVTATAQPPEQAERVEAITLDAVHKEQRKPKTLVPA